MRKLKSVEKKRSFLVQPAEKVLTVISFSTSFVSVMCIRDVVLLEVDRSGMISLNVGFAQIREQIQQTSMSA